MNFLQPDTIQIRQSILDIDDSYNNSWDIIAELCQNSVDAIRVSKENKNHQVQIAIDSTTKQIEVKDTGIGIAPDALVSQRCEGISL